MASQEATDTNKHSSEATTKDMSHAALSSEAAEEDLQESGGKDVNDEGDTDMEEEEEEEEEEEQEDEDDMFFDQFESNPHALHRNNSIKEPMGESLVSSLMII